MTVIGRGEPVAAEMSYHTVVEAMVRLMSERQNDVRAFQVRRASTMRMVSSSGPHHCCPASYRRAARSD